MRRLVLPLALLFSLSSVLGCAALTRQSRSSSSSGSRNCASCARMCEVAGDARGNPAAVDRCKADCKKKCG